MARIPLSLVNDEKNVVLQLVLIVVGDRLLDRAHPTVKRDRSSDSPSSTDGKQSVTNHVTSSLQDQIEQISRDAKGRVGVAVTAIETGESVALNGKQQFPMQSVYKFPIGMAVLFER